MSTPSDGSSNPESAPASTSSPVAMTALVIDPVEIKLIELGVSADIAAKIKNDLGATSLADLAGLTEADLIGVGLKALPARRVLSAFAPIPAAPVAGSKVDPNAELPEGAAPSKEQVTGFAGQTGMDPMMLMMLMNGQGMDMGLADMMPIATVVAGYNPKLRNMFLMVMGQVERRLGVPCIVIDADGAINRPLTIEYIEGLEEGREAAENNIYFDGTGIPHEVIRVGVDAQSIYDADPLEPSKALQKSGMGIGRVNWNNVGLEARQVAYYAATKTREIDPTSDAHLSWLRDHMKAGANRLTFAGQAPRALGEYNEAARTGSLPTLRVMLSRGPRRPELMPRRRSTSPRDLSGIGSNGHDPLADRHSRS